MNTKQIRKTGKLFCLLILLSFSACRLAQDKNISPDNTGDINSLIFPENFDYGNSQEVSLKVGTSALGNRLANVPLKIYDKNPEEGGQLMFSGQTNSAGTFTRNVVLPAHLKELYMVVQYIGLAREHVLPITNDAINYDITMKSGNGQRTTAGSQTKRTTNTYTYLGTYDNNGVPNYLTTNDVFDNLFLTDVNYTLPENAPVPDYHPEYLAVGNVTDIKVTQEADIWVTFVHEGAGWRNSLGYYTYDLNDPPQTAQDIAELNIVFPNVSLSGSGGGLNAGNKVYLGKFPAGTGIGWFLVAQGWKSNSQSVVNSQYTVYSNPDFNPEGNASDRQHNVLIKDSQRKLVLLGFEDVRRDYASCDQDFNDAVFYVTANPYTAITNDNMPEATNSGTDTDNDGVADVSDDFPSDPNRSFSNHLPAENTFGTLAFEDLWPSKGDFDFNDLVVNYHYELITNAQDQVTEMKAQYVIRAVGASYQNGFAVQLPINASDVASVTGSQLTENYVTLASNGVEANQSKAVVMVFDNAYKHVQRPAGFFVNTERNAPVVTADTFNLTITLASPIDFSTLNGAPYNPFIMVNQVRGHEVHLIDQAPTDLADLTLLGTSQDKSKPNQAKYYRTRNNLPFALHIPVSFDYPLEKKGINTAFLKFVEWSQSEGSSFTDWYLNKDGYRDENKIY
ncbi:MAG TPA: hypothetical protein DCS93_05740 [Microscillaceae bacterium]|nr:hypothetical protein [Microscillaceae bacterium]